MPYTPQQSVPGHDTAGLRPTKIFPWQEGGHLMFIIPPAWQKCPVLTITQCGPVNRCKKMKEVWQASHRTLQWRSINSERSGHIALLRMYITCWLLFRLGVPFVTDAIEKEHYFCLGSTDVECAAERLLTIPFFCCFALYMTHLFLIVLYFCTFFFSSHSGVSNPLLQDYIDNLVTSSCVRAFPYSACETGR